MIYVYVNYIKMYPKLYVTIKTKIVFYDIIYYFKGSPLKTHLFCKKSFDFNPFSLLIPL